MVIRKGAIKISRKSNLVIHLGIFPSKMSWLSRNFPVMLTVKVAVNCLLSSIPLIDTVFAPFGLKACFPGEAYDKGV